MAKHLHARGQTPLHFWIGPFIGIGAIWMIATHLGWWTVLVFVVLSVLAGLIQVRAKYNHWSHTLLAAGNAISIAGLLLTASAWLV